MAEIRLATGEHVLVDDEDFSHLNTFYWSFHPKGGAKRSTEDGGSLLMHRQITDAQPGDTVVHLNGDKLDNRKANLRVSRSRPGRVKVVRAGTTSRFKGVSRNGEVWRAMISHDGVKRYLGTFATEEAAAAAYDREARRLRGAHTPTNGIG